MKTKAIIRLKFPTGKHLHSVFKALQPEVQKSATLRSDAAVLKSDTMLVLCIAAKDTVALRAVVNAYLRWTSSIFEVLSTLERLIRIKK